jgi:hypothetical protein
VAVSDVEALSQYIEPRLFRQLQFSGCRFSHVNFDGLRCKRAHFQGCTFASVVFGETRVGSLQRVRFERCSFESVRLSHLFVSDSQFADCTFERVVSTSTKWEHCSFERTVMRGSLEKVAFLDSRFVDADFTGALMQSCHIVGPAVGVALPDRAGLFVLAPDRLKRVAASVAAELTVDGRERFSRAAEVYSRINGPLIIDETIWSDLPREDRALVMSRLFALRKSSD